MKMHELFTELSAEKRLGILTALSSAPMKFTEISNKLSITSPETSRHLTRLNDAGLLEKRLDGTYQLTPYGRAVLSCLPTIDFISREKTYFLKHDSSPLPLSLLRRIDELSEGRVINSFIEILNTVDKEFNHIQEFFWFMSDDFPRYFLPKCEEQLERGVKYRVIFPRDFIPTLLSLKVKNLEKVELRSLDKVNMTIDVSDRFSALALPSTDGEIDHSSCIIGSDSRFRQWCGELFNHYWEKAEKVDLGK